MRRQKTSRDPIFATIAAHQKAAAPYAGTASSAALSPSASVAPKHCARDRNCAPDRDPVQLFIERTVRCYILVARHLIRCIPVNHLSPLLIAGADLLGDSCERLRRAPVV